MRERDDRRPLRPVVAETSPDRRCGRAEGLDRVTDGGAGRVDPDELRVEVVRDDSGLDAEPLGDAPGAAQPSPDGPLGNVEPLGDRAVPLPARVGQRRSADDLDGVPPPGKAPVGEQDRRRPAGPAASPSRPLPAALSARPPKPSSSPMAPRRQRGPTATQQPASERAASTAAASPLTTIVTVGASFHGSDRRAADPGAEGATRVGR